jgi:CxxC motif-containing protein (DUF1111 family)
MRESRTGLRLFVLVSLLVGVVAGGAAAQLVARDRGVRAGAAGAGGPLTGLSAPQLALFTAGSADFQEVDGVGEGLGPRFNLDSCAGCHTQPAVGGSSPPTNPQIAVATAFGARNTVPSFLAIDGPVREVRFKRNADGTPDGGVHALFVISGRRDAGGDASGCAITQPNFERHYAAGNVSFRIPTPVFGAGLIEQIPDAAILANRDANATAKAALGIAGRPNRIRITGEPNNNGNDGTIARFGWKAQNKSLLLFSAEAYNVEQGITNEIFSNEREENAACQFNGLPEDLSSFVSDTEEAHSGITKFAAFMRFLAPPAPGPQTASTVNGRALFESVGCALCHTPTLTTGKAASAALSQKPVNLFSDLLLHDMGTGLADDIVQGAAGPREFRTAPLWGLGQRLFFLHDGRTGDLVTAIAAHASPGSEANGAVKLFNALGDRQKQDVLNFLRSL